jgi:hypothetical protein
MSANYVQTGYKTSGFTADFTLGHVQWEIYGVRCWQIKNELVYSREIKW